MNYVNIQDFFIDEGTAHIYDNQYAEIETYVPLEKDELTFVDGNIKYTLKDKIEITKRILIERSFLDRVFNGGFFQKYRLEYDVITWKYRFQNVLKEYLT